MNDTLHGGKEQLIFFLSRSLATFEAHPTRFRRVQRPAGTATMRGTLPVQIRHNVHISLRSSAPLRVTGHSRVTPWHPLTPVSCWHLSARASTRAGEAKTGAAFLSPGDRGPTCRSFGHRVPPPPPEKAQLPGIIALPRRLRRQRFAHSASYHHISTPSGSYALLRKILLTAIALFATQRCLPPGSDK